MRWLEATFFFILVSAVETQPHLGRCPELNEPPPANSGGCTWVVAADFRGCRHYVEECGVPNNCTGAWEMLWKCSSNCPPTCAEKWPGCGEECGPPRCQCVGGYVRNYDGNCIRIFDCPTQQPHPNICSINEIFKTCSSMCEPTCFTDPHTPCPVGCGPPKCECRPGLVRNHGVCIWKDQCPPYRRAPSDDLMLRAPQQPQQPKAQLCSINEQYMECSSLCEPTCTSPPNQPCPLGCGPPRCQCKPGFVRHDGQCILRSQCPGSEPPQRCGPNEHFVTCSSMCEATCSSRPDDPCPLGCGPPKCECMPGFVRHQGGCIPRSQCPSQPPQRCGPNEHFVTCSSMCEATCSSRPNDPCPLGCGPPKCECLPGFVRHQGRCIQRNQCPRPQHCRTHRDCPTNYECEHGQCVLRESNGGIHPRAMDEDLQLSVDRLVSEGDLVPLATEGRKRALDPLRPPICGPDEVYMRCSSHCEPTCFSEPNRHCPGCGPPKCQCQPGYVRYEGTCIRTDQCPRQIEFACEHESQCPTGTTCMDGKCSGGAQWNNAETAILQNQLKACTTNEGCESGATCFDGFCHHVGTKK